jgi:regulator of protease activity HflC (stomatin/prohibitin superfamily)
MGIDKLIDLFVQFLEAFRFCTIVDCYQEGVCLRFGKFHRELKPGFHWLIPFYVENPIIESVVSELHQLPTQSIATRDDKQIAVGAVICFSIRHIEKATLKVHSVNHAVNDACQTSIAELILAATWDEVRAPAFSDKMTELCRARGWKFGIEIESVRFCELALVRTHRVISGV